MTTGIGTRAGIHLAALAAVAVLCALIAPAAQAKSARLDGTLVANATKKGSKVQAPVLFSGKSAKKLKLGSPIATLVLKGSKNLQAPNPAGGAPVAIAPDTLRAGDRVKGKGKLKGSAKKLMPVVKAGKVAVTDRESAYSVDEVTAALVALYQQVGALGLRVDALESSIAALQTEIEKLKQENASLTGQLNTLVTQVLDLETALQDLTSLVGGLPTAAELQGLLDDIADLQNQIDTLGIGDIAGLQGELTSLQGQITGLLTDVNAICGLPIIGGVCT